MNRAFSLIEVKGFDDSRRTFSGVATTPAPDRVKDTINPLKAAFAAEIPLLHQHKHDAPIGRVRFGKPTKDGIAFEAEIPNIPEPGPLKDRVDTAWGELKHGLVRAVSIGFMPTENPSVNKMGGLDFEGIEIWELSTVTIPANSQAIINVVKSVDAEARKEAGVDEPPADGFVAPIPEEPQAATGVRVVKLDTPARDRAAFVVREIKRT